MKIEMDRGQPLIDAQDLGKLLGLDPADVQTKMRAGEITSRFETGEGEEGVGKTWWSGGQFPVSDSQSPVKNGS
uniref:DUF6522 family protein n=1 Tax=Primorskyibacter flagellatus TaxID=1387277 RepID=UPI003A8E5A5F